MCIKQQIEKIKIDSDELLEKVYQVAHNIPAVPFGQFIKNYYANKVVVRVYPNDDYGEAFALLHTKKEVFRNITFNQYQNHTRLIFCQLPKAIDIQDDFQTVFELDKLPSEYILESYRKIDGEWIKEI
ncbi:hypothetical protein A1D22_09695 [Pasteurellaceae bacterium LFhippo2]|nr:hypothetical protein [Pasteurellaceae bacterium LFhippo2]